MLATFPSGSKTLTNTIVLRVTAPDCTAVYASANDEAVRQWFLSIAAQQGISLSPGDVTVNIRCLASAARRQLQAELSVELLVSAPVSVGEVDEVREGMRVWGVGVGRV